MSRTPYPGRHEEVYVIHRLYEGGSFPPGGTWGDVGDGPITDADEAHEAILESWKGEDTGPTTATLRVWVIWMGEALDVTKVVIAGLESDDDA